ncbi:MAG TPA: cytochrome c biogenesis protein CcsA [Methylomirabilota bacterium]|nr:cytochrome c biogenesis protein CcsA [Methylomirabilota bacterium]
MALTDRTLFALAVILYGLAAVYSIFSFRRGFREDNWINYGLLLLALAVHTAAMFKRGFSLARCPIHNLYEAITFVLWTIAAVYVVFGSWSRLRFLGAFAAPLLFGAGVFALMPPLDPPHGENPVFTGGWVSLHAALTLLSYGAFGLASVAALMFLTQDRDLKVRKIRAILSRMPSLQRLELVIGRLVLAGFILLTLGLASGALRLPGTVGIAAYWTDSKVVWSACVWGMYLVLLVLRWRYAHRGRRFALSAVGGFAFVLMTFWGTNLLSTIHNPGPSVAPPAPPPMPIR